MIIAHHKWFWVCIKLGELINHWPSNKCREGGRMEQTEMMKGIGLFATLIGVYQWLGQGTSLLDIIIILFTVSLIISMDPRKGKEGSVQKEAPLAEHKEKEGFFKKALTFG